MSAEVGVSNNSDERFGAGELCSALGECLDKSPPHPPPIEHAGVYDDSSYACDLAQKVVKCIATGPQCMMAAQVDDDDDDDEGIGARRGAAARRGGIVLSEDED